MSARRAENENPQPVESIGGLVVAGGRHHRNRLASPSRWTFSDRRARFIRVRSYPTDLIGWDSAGTKCGNKAGIWESDRVFAGGRYLAKPEKRLAVRGGQPDLRTRETSPSRIARGPS